MRPDQARPRREPARMDCRDRPRVFALAVDPANDKALIAGNSKGSLLRSTDGGSTWSTVHTGSAAVTTIAFSPFTRDLVLAGSRGSGALISTDGGAKWTAVKGMDGRDVRVFGFALTLVAAGTDNGVYLSDDGTAWNQSGLANTSIDALTVAAVHVPVRLVAGSDTFSTAAGPPLYESSDAGATWASVTPAISGTVVSRLVAGPLPPTGNVRPLVAGTNAGLFISRDNGATFIPLSGADLLPSTDYTQIAYVTDHYDRFYVATFRASDHTPALWAFHDTGAPPQGPFTGVTPSASASRIGPHNRGGVFEFLRVLSSSQTPYIALGGVALLVLLLAAISHFRGSRR